MPHAISVGLNIIAAIAGLTAAFYWFRASAVSSPEQIVGSGGFGGPVLMNVKPLTNYVRETGRLNKIAARWSGVAAACAGLGTLAGLWSP
jgi:hypothetical protein